VRRHREEQHVVVHLHVVAEDVRHVLAVEHVVVTAAGGFEAGGEPGEVGRLGHVGGDLGGGHLQHAQLEAEAPDELERREEDRLGLRRAVERDSQHVAGARHGCPRADHHHRLLDVANELLARATEDHLSERRTSVGTNEPQAVAGQRLVEQHVGGGIIRLDHGPAPDALIGGQVAKTSSRVRVVMGASDAHELDRHLAPAGELDCMGDGLLALGREVDRDDDVIEHGGLLC
jgi:hypothetical protein